MLVGRGRELNGLGQLLDAAELGRGGLRVLYGEPGIGKTRLCDEVAARAAARGFAVSWGRAWETGGAPAYFPWRELLGALRAAPPERVRGLLDGHARAPVGERTNADPERERFELFESVTSYLRACASDTPLLLLFDDLHMTDAASLELLCFVARGVRASRIALIGTSRDAEARLPRVADVLARLNREGEVLALRPLSGEDVAEIVRHELGRFDGALTAALLELTEGNPLFLRETLHAVATSAHPASVQTLREIATLGGVLALVRARLSGAGAQARGQFEVAAAIGREVSLPLFAEIAGASLDEARALLEDGARRGLLVRRGEAQWAFSHVLVREAFYRELLPERRRALHAAIAGVLGRRVEHGNTELLPTLAHHALAALPDGGIHAALRIARRAAEHARAQLGYEEAVAVLEQALLACEAHAADRRDHAEVLLALGWAATESGRLDRGRDLFRTSAEVARKIGDARLLARAALGQGGEYVLAEIRSELVGVLREALAALEPETDVEASRLRVRLLARLAAALTPSATPDEPLAIAMQALALTAHETDVRTRVDVGVGVGAALADFAPPRQRIPVNERLLIDARDTGDRVLELRALTRLSCDYLESGDVARADATIAARGAFGQALGHARYRWQSSLLHSMRAMPEGRFDACEAAISEAREVAEQALDPNAARSIEMHRFSMLIVAGRTTELRDQLPATLQVFDPLPDRAALCAWASAAVDARLGDRARALEALHTLGQTSVMSSRTSRLMLAETAVLCEAHEFCERIYASFAEDDDSHSGWGPFAFVSAPPVARTLALIAFTLGRIADGERHSQLALAVSERMRAPAHLAWVQLTWGEGLAASDPARAAPHLEQALQLATQYAMPDVVARARALLSVMPQAATPRTPAQHAAHDSQDPPAFALRRDGDHWSIEYLGRGFRLKDMRGLGMLARLLESPGSELAAIELATDSSGTSGGAIDLGDAGELLDPRARAEYTARTAELEREIDEAESFADTGRAERLRAEREALTDQLSAAFGVGGRERRAGSAIERARVSVQRRIRDAIRKIAEHDPELARHLDWTVRTGAYCAYEPRGRRPAR